MSVMPPDVEIKTIEVTDSKTNVLFKTYPEGEVTWMTMSNDYSNTAIISFRLKNWLATSVVVKFRLLSGTESLMSGYANIPAYGTHTINYLINEIKVANKINIQVLLNDVVVDSKQFYINRGKFVIYTNVEQSKGTVALFPVIFGNHYPNKKVWVVTNNTMCTLYITNIPYGFELIQYDLKNLDTGEIQTKTEPTTLMISSNIEVKNVVLRHTLVAFRPLEDVNVDGYVNMMDVAMVCNQYGKSETDPDFNPLCDIDGSGRVDLRDVGNVANACFNSYNDVIPISIGVSSDVRYFSQTLIDSMLIIVSITIISESFKILIKEWRYKM